MDGKTVAGKDSLYSSASIDADTRQLIIKVINTSATAQAVELNLQGKVKPQKTYNLVTLSSTEKFAYNTLDAPDKISPKQRSGNISSGKIAVGLAPLSVNVFKVSY
jgi:alpha-N-arabinofuranosidase